MVTNYEAVQKTGFTQSAQNFNAENAKLKSLWQNDLRALRNLCAFSVNLQKLLLTDYSVVSRGFVLHTGFKQGNIRAVPVSVKDFYQR